MLVKSLQKKIELETWLDEVDYVSLNSSYVPSEFALVFMNFIKLVNGEEGEQHKTPPVHLKMLDKMVGSRRYVANLCFRGAAKALSLGTPLLTEGGWSTVAAVQPGDRIYGEDGQLTTILAKSEIFNEPMYRLHLGDGRTLDVSENHINTIIHKRVKRVEGRCTTYYDRRDVTTKELLSIPLGSTRTKTEKNPRGWENSVWIPLAQPVDSPKKELPVDPYTLGVLLGDGSISRQTEYARLHCHKDDLPHYLTRIPYETGRQNLDKRNNNVVTVGVLGLGKQLKAMGLNCHGDDKQIPDAYLHGSIKQRVALLQGLMDTDGTVNKASPSFATNSLALAQGVLYLVYSLGGVGRLHSQTTASGKKGYRVTLNCPMEVFSLPRKVEKKKAKFLNKVPLIKIEPVDQVASQCLMVDNETKTFLAGDFVVTHNTTLFMEYMTLYIAVMGNLPGFGDVSGMIYVADSMDNGAKSARKNIEFRYNNSTFLQEWLPDAKFTDAYMEFTNRDGHKLGVKMFGAKSGIRGTKIFGKRPTLCILDDLVSDDDAKSPTSMQAIKDTVYKGVFPALDPTRRKVVFNGTPFNKDDIIIEAVESGAWDVNVWPVCERFPCEPEEFVGAWEDRFDYAFVKEQYDLMAQSGKLAAFYQEYMLRITSEEDRLIHDHDIRWYSRDTLLANKGIFHFYITTDFATSAKQSADYTVISVWAYNANGEWFWVDGIAARQTMDKTVNDLFSLVHEYQPLSVGVEITGQQGGFIPWLQEQMFTRNIWFTFASSEKSGAPGIRSAGDKLVRMNMVLPWFKAGKMHFPKEMQTSNIMGLFMGQLRLVTQNGIKGKDDCLDTISQLAYLKPWKPSQSRPVEHAVTESSYWTTPTQEAPSALSSYIV